MPYESEANTRRKRIDPKLKALCWIVLPYVDGMNVSQLTRHAVEEYQTDNGPADYALFVNGVLLGIVEAKKLAVGAQNVLEQAKRYSLGATRDFRLVLDNEFGSNCDARKSFREKYVSIADQIIRQNWPVVEALANELMVKGKICFGKTEAVEKRYGIGRDTPTPARQASAQQKLAAFHSSPDDLLEALRVIS